jgi:glycosyltransferase involved in cell wall biosynthesis
MPLVTVLLPCYNAELYIEEAVRSIMNQTYSNLEILIIDDCSTDSSHEIVSRLAIEDERIRIIKNEKNLKLIKTLNKGLDLARGDYIARMDADDVSLPERIEKQINYMLSNPEVDLCGTNYTMINAEGNIIGTSNYPLTNLDIKLNLLFYNPFAHPTVLFKRDFVNKIGKYKENFINAEDYELWLRVALNGVMSNIQDKLLLYRWHGNNISLIGGKKQNLESVSLAIMENTGILRMISLDFLDFHSKFVCMGGWKQGTVDELKRWNEWESTLLTKHIDNYYKVRGLIKLKSVGAMFCLLKNYQLNTPRVCAMALWYLILNPKFALKYLLKNTYA